MKLNYRMVIHNIIEKEEEYIFIGEAYYPTYRTESYTTFVNGVSSTQTRQVFDGYQYTHAAIASFDQKGNMNWSNTFEMWLDYKPYSAKEFITVSTYDNKVSMIYINGSVIKSTSFKDGQAVTDKNIEIVNTGDENDKLKWTTSAETDYWYDDNFIASGFQKIINSKERIGNKRRKVFFLNKIEY